MAAPPAAPGHPAERVDADACPPLDHGDADPCTRQVALGQAHESFGRDLDDDTGREAMPHTAQGDTRAQVEFTVVSDRRPTEL